MPKVSVLTPLYNTNHKFLKEMIESILNQTFDDFEFILLNDSPNNKELKDIVLSYKDNRIIYVENEENIGISKSRNKLLELAKGEYIAIFDHDDISLPQRLEKQVDFLDKNPKVGIVGSNIIKYSNKKKSNNPENNLDIKINLVARGCIILHSTVMIRKSLLTENSIKWEEVSKKIYETSKKTEGKSNISLEKTESFSEEEIKDMVETLETTYNQVKQDFPNYDTEELACKLEYQIKTLTKNQKENLIVGEKLSTYLSGKVDCRRYKKIT